MFEDQRFILSRDIPLEIAIAFGVFALVVAGIAVWGYRTGGSRGENMLRATSAVLTGLGLAVSGYIAYKTLIADEPFQCIGGSSGCSQVEESKYARFLGIHMSIWGLIGYTTILGATIWKGDNARLTVFALSLFGFVTSLVLRYLELWEINASCQWCVASAVLMTMLLVLSSCRLLGYYGTGDGEIEAAESEPES
ncbi:MAG: hypothetical protein QG596_2006 [Actinomycetota bacterium]|jgi:uncharacterized membrane protein|nr:hypothetical protein [Actinomycetota bacterium]